MPPNTQLPVYPHSSFLLFIFSFVFSCLGKPSSFMHVVMSTAILHILLSIESEHKGEKFVQHMFGHKCLLIFQPITADLCSWNFRTVFWLAEIFVTSSFAKTDWQKKSKWMFDKEFLGFIAWEELHLESHEF